MIIKTGTINDAKLNFVNKAKVKNIGDKKNNSLFLNVARKRDKREKKRPKESTRIYCPQQEIGKSSGNMREIIIERRRFLVSLRSIKNIRIVDR
jgi:hypothetical protein